MLVDVKENQEINKILKNIKFLLFFYKPEGINKFKYFQTLLKVHLIPQRKKIKIEFIQYLIYSYHHLNFCCLTLMN